MFLAISSLVRLALGASTDLKVEEAYYWCYSQHLAPGYFDHPPMVAWLIALVSPLGAASWVVRLPAIALFAASGWLLFLTLRRWYDEETGMVGVLLHTMLPAFHWYSLIMLPDAPLMFFWTLGIYASTRLLQDEDPRWWWVIGLATGLGMDSKYPAALLPLGAFLSIWLLKKDPRLALNLPMVGGALLALALFSPVVYWNATHDFASFRFQGAERFQEVTSTREKAASLIYPAVMLGPLLYLAVPWVINWAGRQWRRPGVVVGICFTLPFSLLILYVSSRRLVNMNWPLPAYLGFLLLLAPWIVADRRRWMLVVPSAIFSFLPLLALVVPMAVANRGDDINQWQPMARRAKELQQQMPHPDRTFFLGYGYQAASQLAFAGLPLDRIVSVNALGMRALAYDYWTQPSTLVGWDAIVVDYCRVKANGNWHPQLEVDEPLLQQHFERVEPALEQEELRAGQRLRLYRYRRAFNYREASAGSN